MTMADTIAVKLEQALSPREIKVLDVSHHHAGHAGWREGGETHFEVRIRADIFAGKSRVECHRMVNGILAEELAGEIHALQLDLAS